MSAHQLGRDLRDMLPDGATLSITASTGIDGVRRLAAKISTKEEGARVLAIMPIVDGSGAMILWPKDIEAGLCKLLRDNWEAG